jgi:hypothetical protein
VAHNVPWVTTVGASTYDGDIALVGNKLEVTYNNDNEPEDLFSIPGAITTPIPEDGLAGALQAADPLEACDPLNNDLAGNIAYIARGTCAFTTKILNAQDAGAIGVVVYSDARAPTAMGGSSDGITVPGVMITNEDGLRLLPDVLEMDVNVNMTLDGIANTVPSVGNMMAGFSSRGESLATADIIKPDITAPGVSVLAGTSGSQIDSGTMGESYTHLSGTSMSSPHIAGLAALVREAHPTWSPAAVKSAMMTTAYQGVTKEDGDTPADPFDFGAGHVAPNSSVDPGFVYDATFNDYYAFLCGAGDADFVEADYFPGACGALADAGFPTDPSDLNLASIAIEELSETQTIRRYVNNVSESDSFTASVDAPPGVDVSIRVLDWDLGGFVNSDTMGFRDDDGLGIYELTFSKNDAAVIDQWTFGSITWSDGTRNVRSPIALKPTVPPRIAAPDSVSIETARSAARITLPVDINYNGRFFAKGIGLDAPDVFVDTVFQDPDSTFVFNEPGLGFYFVNVPAGTRIAKFGLSGADQFSPAVDLDLYVYACPQFRCSRVGQSFNSGSDESVVLVDPAPLADLGNSDIYVVFVHGWSLAGAESVLAPLYVWTVDESRPTGMSVRASTRAVEGRTNRVYVGMYGLQSGTDYVGGVLYKDENGDENGMTVIEVKAK